MERAEIWELGRLFIFIVGAILLGTISLIRAVNKFYKLADELEVKIKTNYEFEQQMSDLITLSKKSMHKTTGSRVRELAKMMEIKYNTEILKR